MTTLKGCYDSYSTCTEVYMGIVITSALTVMVGIVYASIFEWVLHRYIMHRPFGALRYPFEAHALTHHRIFKADYSYHLQHAEDRRKIHMAWWNGPILVLLSSLPFVIGAIPFVIFAWWVGGLVVIGTGVVLASCYYGAYEYLHFCMHLPKNRRVERSWIFLRLNGHHLLHHRYMGTNFNVVCPIADALFGTLILRAKFSFAQARGPSIPDVQPIPSGRMDPL
ncbi:MAG: fatty acid hydroxylase [Patescibacteria group bacterium]